MTEDIFLAKVKEHEGIINKLLYLYVDSKEDKKDMYQEIVLQAWRSIQRFRGEAQFSTWLYRVGLNTVMTFNRQEKKMRKESIENTSLQTDPPSEKSDRSYQLSIAIKQLTDIDKSIITLHLEDYNNYEISDIIGISKNNVAVKIHRIKDELKRKLNSNG